MHPSIMLTFSLLLFSLLMILLSSTIVQAYTATDRFFLDCGTSSTTTADGRRWDGDESSKFILSNVITTSFNAKPDFLDPSVDPTPYSTARIFNTSSFTYNFPVSAGPKFLRLYFYPTTYAGLNPNDSYFSVSSNGYSLLTNFSAYLTASFLTQSRLDTRFSNHVLSFVKEYIVHVKDTQTLNVTFTPSPASYAFINGIEIVSMPDNLYFNNLKYVGMDTGPNITNDMALENIYRLNMGGKQITGGGDTGMYRTWDQDNAYVYGTVTGMTPYYSKQITYTTDTPNYTAPEEVYKSQRSMGNMSDTYNLTWILPDVDSGFYYTLRLHFCNIIANYTNVRQVVFKIFINNQTADEEIDVFQLTYPDSGYPVYKDYVVFVHDPAGNKGKQLIWVALQPNKQLSQLVFDAYLNGLEAFKLSMDKNLSSSNPELIFTTPPTVIVQTTLVDRNKKKPPYAAIVGGIGGALFLLTILVLIVLKKRRQVKNYGEGDDRSSYVQAYSESKSTHSTLPSDRCRRFSLTEVKAATNEFNDDFVIGIGGFGKVYKGYIDNAATVVAIKRLNESSSQGFQEFHTEIGLLSKLRHVQLVSLIGYCDDDGEMILVYDYMAHGTLREHLYKTNKPPLSWKRRLQICIGAAKGLHYLHTGAKRSIIHRDVKSTNILLDENWVAKVSDFGLSKLGPRDQEQSHVSTVVKGSIGYVDPEYYRSRQLTDKSDVYSFGVVLLEVLCARPVMILGLPKEQVSLAEWGKICYRKGTLTKIIDPKLRSAITPECLRQFGAVAVSCLIEKGCERPTMDEVVWGLEFALQLQEDAEKTVGKPVPENQELPFLIQGETTTTTTTDDDAFTGSSAMRNGTSSISSSDEGFKSETVFSELLKPTGR